MNRTVLHRSMSHRSIRVLVIALTTAVTALVLPATAQAGPYCGLAWGSLPEQVGRSAPARADEDLTAVRAGRHDCFDRLVLDVTGATDGVSYRVEYVAQVRADGSGAVVPVAGGARLQITVGAHGRSIAPAVGHDLVDVAGYRTFRQVLWAGGFEGYSGLGLGVRARVPFRVFALTGPGATVRVVIDVAHRW
jgi:hypothetical protein